MISSSRYKKISESRTIRWKNNDHSLVGQKRPVRELRINPDWLLIYLIDDKQLILTVVQTGMYSDLFGHKQYC